MDFRQVATTRSDTHAHVATRSTACLFPQAQAIPLYLPTTDEFLAKYSDLVRVVTR